MKKTVSNSNYHGPNYLDCLMITTFDTMSLVSVRIWLSLLVPLMDIRHTWGVVLLNYFSVPLFYIHCCGIYRYVFVFLLFLNCFCCKLFFNVKTSFKGYVIELKHEVIIHLYYILNLYCALFYISNPIELHEINSFYNYNTNKYTKIYKLKHTCNSKRV